MVPTTPALTALPAPAASTTTLQLTPASGPVVTIALDSYQFGFQNPVGIGSATRGAGAGKASFNGLDVSAAFAADSPLLLMNLFSGTGYTSAVLTQNNAGGQPAAVWALNKVIVASDDMGASSGNLPDEALQFEFGAVTEATAAQSASWSLSNSISTPPVATGLAALPAPAASTATLQLTPASGPAVTITLDSYQFGFQNPVSLSRQRIGRQSELQ
jgi:type VI protein secretion system component Hcp